MSLKFDSVWSQPRVQKSGRIFVDLKSRDISFDKRVVYTLNGYLNNSVLITWDTGSKMLLCDCYLQYPHCCPTQ